MAKANKRIGTCELCLREDVETTAHHLTPREMGGAYLGTADLCIPCHKQIHALYTNEELAVRLNTVALLQDDPQIAKYIAWIKKQPSTKLQKVKKSKDRRGRK